VLGTNNEQCGYPCPIEGEQSGVARGVAHAPLVASRAGGDSRPDSDIYIMIEIDPEAHIGVFDDVVLKDHIAALFDAPVDVVSREGLKSCIRPAAMADAISAFKTGRHRAEESLPQIDSATQFAAGVGRTTFLGARLFRLSRQAMRAPELAEGLYTRPFLFFGLQNFF
jgi:hypothetical protein